MDTMSCAGCGWGLGSDIPYDDLEELSDGTARCGDCTGGYEVGDGVKIWDSDGPGLERGVIVAILQDGIEVYWPGATSAAGVRSIIEWGQMANVVELTFAQCEGMASKL